MSDFWICWGRECSKIITQEKIKEKTLNAVHEIKARGGKVLIITQFEDLKNEGNVIFLPKLKEELMPLISVIPLQFLLTIHL